MRGPPRVLALPLAIVLVACDPPILIFDTTEAPPPPPPECATFDIREVVVESQHVGSTAVWGGNGTGHLISQGTPPVWFTVDQTGATSTVPSTLGAFIALDAVERLREVVISGAWDLEGEGFVTSIVPGVEPRTVSTGEDMIIALAAYGDAIFGVASAATTGALLRRVGRDGVWERVGVAECPVPGVGCAVREAAAAVDAGGFAYLSSPNPTECLSCLLVVRPDGTTFELDLALDRDQVNAMARLESGEVAAATLSGALRVLWAGEVVRKATTGFEKIAPVGTCRPIYVGSHSPQAIAAWGDGLVLANCGYVAEWRSDRSDCFFTRIPADLREGFSPRRLHAISANKLILTGNGRTLLITVTPGATR